MLQADEVVAMLRLHELGWGTKGLSKSWLYPMPGRTACHAILRLLDDADGLVRKERQGALFNFLMKARLLRREQPFVYEVFKEPCHELFAAGNTRLGIDACELSANRTRRRVS